MTASATLIIIGALALAAAFIKEPIKIKDFSLPILPNALSRNVAGFFGLLAFSIGVFLAFREIPSASSTTGISPSTASAIPTLENTVTPVVSVTPTFTEAVINSSNPTPSITPVIGEYKALFYLHAPQDFWLIGGHSYIIEFGCTTNIEKPFTGNNGNAVFFNVRESNLLKTPSFFLRYDSVYDSMTNGNPIDVVSKSSPSFATVVITRFTYDEAQKVLDECNASISVDGFQSVNLDEYERPVLNLQEIDLESLPTMRFFP